VLDYSEASVTTSGSVVSKRNVLERYRSLRDDHLRYMAKWGLIRPVRTGADTHYAFSDLALLRQADAELADGVTFRAVLRNLLAAKTGQLAFDFRIDAPVAKVLTLTRKQPPPMAALMEAHLPEEPSSAERYFQEASLLDDGDPQNVEPALRAYRRALEIDPYLVPALINLANLHYSRDDVVEAQALYERAIALEPDVFEAHFNLGNIFHDLARYIEAQACYREALRLNPTYAEAHFYLAVTLEKNGRSQEARLHWRAYQQLAPGGEWVHLAKEFSEDPKA
jgi:tetratricopeptide (TPR) repeat protein